MVGHGREQVEADARAALRRARAHGACRPSSAARATRRAAAPMPLPNYAGRLLVLYGDAPLLTREPLRAADRARGRSRRADSRCSPRACPTPRGYGRILRDAQGRVIGDPRAARTASPEQARDHARSTRACTRSHAPFFRSAVARLSSRQRAGRALPDRPGRAAPPQRGAVADLAWDARRARGRQRSRPARRARARAAAARQPRCTRGAA